MPTGGTCTLKLVGTSLILAALIGLNGRRGHVEPDGTSPKRLLDRPSAILASTGTLEVSMMGARAELISGLVVAVAVQLAR
jgi:hypothetical protein